MSTKGLYGFIENSEYRANMNHSDSYPSGLGLEFFLACKQDDLVGFPILENKIRFIHNSLFCEWAYFYNLDNKEFEIWKGFQTKPDKSNPFGQNSNEDGYYPCKRIFKGHIETVDREIFDNKKIEDVIKSIERDIVIDSILK